jgi:hypothetical protein
MQIAKALTKEGISDEKAPGSFRLVVHLISTFLAPSSLIIQYSSLVRDLFSHSPSLIDLSVNFREDFYVLSFGPNSASNQGAPYL